MDDLPIEIIKEIMFLDYKVIGLLYQTSKFFRILNVAEYEKYKKYCLDLKRNKIFVILKNDKCIVRQYIYTMYGMETLNENYCLGIYELNVLNNIITNNQIKDNVLKNSAINYIQLPGCNKQFFSTPTKYNIPDKYLKKLIDAFDDVRFTKINKVKCIDHYRRGSGWLISGYIETVLELDLEIYKWNANKKRNERYFCNMEIQKYKFVNILLLDYHNHQNILFDKYPKYISI